MQNKYETLRTVSKILKVFGYIIIVTGMIYGLFIIASTANAQQNLQQMPGIGHLFGFIMMFNASVFGILTIGFSEMIMLFIDIEDNTRRTYDLMAEKTITTQNEC